jgi:lysophospholipid acyltransferase (LPLAT)-like uncharacterized protein
MRRTLLQRLIASGVFQKSGGVFGAGYLRLVWKTSRLTIEPPDAVERFERNVPLIMAFWHGQQFLIPFVRRHHKAKVLVSRHRDAEVNAIVAERLGIGVIRGSGDHGGGFERKGGVIAFREMATALNEGYSLGLTADVPKVARVAGSGIVMLARASGRPILPVAVTTSRRVVMNNWDRTTVPLPFGRVAGVAGDLIHVAPHADHAALERARLEVETQLNAVTALAYELADRRS